MAGWAYGSPTVAQRSSTAERPGCWGSKYQNDARECIECNWNSSCRAEVIRLNGSRQPGLSYTNQFTPVQYAQPQVQQQQQVPLYRLNVNPQQVQPQASQIPVPNPTWRPPVAANNPPMAPMNVGWYGAVQDPMFGVIHAVPPPFRPQFHGESFTERVLKNIALASFEAFTTELKLAVRQMFWPPDPPRVELDITPK